MLPGTVYHDLSDNVNPDVAARELFDTKWIESLSLVLEEPDTPWRIVMPPITHKSLTFTSVKNLWNDSWVVQRNVKDKHFAFPTANFENDSCKFHKNKNKNINKNINMHIIKNCVIKNKFTKK